MDTKKIVVAAAVGALTSSAIVTYMSRPKTYEECVLGNIKNAHSQAAATLVARSCREQFPQEYISHEYAWTGDLQR